jgi:branched-chain amino acid transport system ATP-binding protein
MNIRPDLFEKRKGTMALFEFDNVTKSFGGLLAVRELSFSLNPQEIIGLIGPNGAGKTTIFNLVTGMMKPDAGKILFNGEDITRLAPYQICRRGIARTFQLVRTFNRLTALENVVAGRAYGRLPASHIQRARSEAEEILELTGLSNKRLHRAASLGLVDRKRLEIARALATRPKLLLLDEMFAGLNTAEVDDAIDLVKKIRDAGVSLIVVEHVMKVIMGISDRVVVLAVGAKIADGPPEEVVSDEQVIKAYLGKRARC